MEPPPQVQHAGGPLINWSICCLVLRTVARSSQFHRDERVSGQIVVAIAIASCQAPVNDQDAVPRAQRRMGTWNTTSLDRPFYSFCLCRVGSSDAVTLRQASPDDPRRRAMSSAPPIPFTGKERPGNTPSVPLRTITCQPGTIAVRNLCKVSGMSPVYTSTASSYLPFSKQKGPKMSPFAPKSADFRQFLPHLNRGEQHGDCIPAMQIP